MKLLLVLRTVSLLLVPGLAQAQDSLRNALAGDAAADAQRQQMATGLYTFKLGDFRLLAVPSLEMDYNDNLILAKTNTLQDFILKPLLKLTGSYPITQQNSLNFSIGAGYDDYLEHSQISTYRLDSASFVSFDARVKDFLFNFHERFSFSQDPSAEAALAGTATYGEFMNAAGLATTWDLEDVELTLGYDHQNFVSSTSQFSYLDRASELPLARAGFKIRPNMTVGAESGASFTTYDQEALNNYQSYSAGLYADWKPDSFFHIVPRAGYVIYQFQHTSQASEVSQVPQINYFGNPPAFTAPSVPPGQSIQTQDLNTWYADLTVSYKVSESVRYALSAGHEIRPGIQADAIEDSYVRPNVTWDLVEDLKLNTSLFYEHGNQGTGNVTGNLVEIYDWFGGGFTLSYPLMKKRFMNKLLLSLNYHLTVRSSDISSREYTQNIVGIMLAYRP